MAVRVSDYIEYSLTTHRYTLKEEYMKDVYGIELTSVLDSTGDINPATLPKRWLDRISRNVYNFIYGQLKEPMQRKVREYKLAMESDWIDCLQDAMGEQAFATLSENNDNTLNSGIDVEKGKVTDRIDLQKAAVAITTENTLRNGGLLYRGYFEGFDYALLDTKGVDY